eukprot:3892628-Prymnesium_polylepis.1
MPSRVLGRPPPAHSCGRRTTWRPTRPRGSTRSSRSSNRCPSASPSPTRRSPACRSSTSTRSFVA